MTTKRKLRTWKRKAYFDPKHWEIYVPDKHEKVGPCYCCHGEVFVEVEIRELPNKGEGSADSNLKEKKK